MLLSAKWDINLYFVSDLLLQMLMSTATDKQKEALLSSYDMLTNHQKMGERFKFLALLPKSRHVSYAPAGFVEPKV